MDESVQIFETTEGQGDNRETHGLKDSGSHLAKLRTSHEVPEIAGLDISFDPSEDARRAASGMAASLLSQHAPVSTHDKQRKNYMAKSDTIEDVLKKRPKEEDDAGVAALSFMARKPHASQGKIFDDNSKHVESADSVLSSLRKAYNAETDGRQHVETRQSKALEETAEEDNDVGVGEETSMAAMEEKWDSVEAHTKQMAVDALANRGTVVKAEDSSLQPISYKEVQDWLKTIQVDPEALRPFRELEDDDKAVGCGCVPTRRRMRGDVPKLQKRLLQEKDYVLFLTKTDFDFNIANHYRMLRTIYMKLTRNKSCPSIGAHWEVIGFQGGDPRTDINRSGGVFNILNLFFFLAHNFDILKACWLLSQDHEQHFPMACISINITQMVMEAFLEGCLSSVCNKGETLFETLCKLHNAGLFFFYSRWRHRKRTIVDTDQTKKEIRAMLTKKPANLLEELNRGVEDDRKRQDPNKLEFTNLDFSGRDRSQAGPSSAPKRPQAVPTRLRNYSTPDDG